MVKKEYTRKQFIDFLTVTNKATFEKSDVEFRETMYKNKRKITLVVKEPMDSLFPEVDVSEFDRERYAAILPFTQKDEKGEPVVINNGTSVKLIEEKIPEANEAINAVIEKYKDKLDEKNTMDTERNTWLSKKISLSLYSVDPAIIPSVTEVDGKPVENPTAYFEYITEMIGEIDIQLEEDDGKEI